MDTTSESTFASTFGLTLDTSTAFPLNSTASPASQSGALFSTTDENALSDEEKAIVDQMASQIDIENTEQIVTYGSRAQANLAAFSSDMLNKVQTYELGDIGDSLQALTVALDATTDPSKKGLAHVFQKLKRSTKSLQANYAKASTNVDRIEKDLELHRETLAKDIAAYQQMYELNIKYYKELTVYILAGEKALADIRSGKLQALKAVAEASGRPDDAQSYRDLEDLCYRFEKELSNLSITRTIAMQSAPQVRLLQNNDREMLDKIRSSLANTIPLWRNQLVLSLGIEHSTNALKAQQALSDRTNELLLKNSETLKMGTVEIAKQAERPLVDISTLQRCNSDLLYSLGEVVRIHDQGIKQRQQIHDALTKIESDLKQGLLAIDMQRRIL